ncbi:MAG: DMT family transporter [Thermoanaerobaculia bacterium]|nr:DMT family transporter [Thermoanaerobaculia bacterium]
MDDTHEGAGRAEHSERAGRAGRWMIIAAAILWSTGGIGIKAVANGPLEVACLRSVVAAIALFAIFRPRIPRLTPAFFVTLVSYAGCLTCFVTATKWTTAANAIFIQYSGIVWVILMSPRLLGEKLRGRDLVAAVVAFGGMALFFAGEVDARGMAGNLVALLSSLFFAGIYLGLRRERDNGAEAAVCWGNVLAAAALAPFALPGIQVDMKSAAVLFFLGVFQIAVPYALFVRGIKSVPAVQASLLGMLEPVTNPVWVLLLLGERPSPQAIAGGLIVLAAVGWRTASKA